jgi:hypothetical protein
MATHTFLGPQNIFLSCSKNINNSSTSLTINLEACQEDTPLTPMPLKMLINTPSYLHHNLFQCTYSCFGN